MKSLPALVALLAFAPGGTAAAQTLAPLPRTQLCWQGKVDVPRLALPGGYSLAVAKDPKNPACDVDVQAPDGTTAATWGDAEVFLSAATGAGVTDDGTSAVVLIGESGGMHCCESSAIIRLGPRPKRLWTFDIWAGMGGEPPPADMVTLESEDFSRDPKTGRVAIIIEDGDIAATELPRGYWVSVPMAFEIAGPAFADVSRDRISFRTLARQARAQLQPAGLAEFMAANPALDACYRQFPPDGCPAALPSRSDAYWNAKVGVFTVILDDLHSGDLSLAKSDLAAYWPAADRARMQALLLQDYCHQNPRVGFHLPAPPECAGVP